MISTPGWQLWGLQGGFYLEQQLWGLQESFPTEQQHVGVFLPSWQLWGLQEVFTWLLMGPLQLQDQPRGPHTALDAASLFFF